MKYLSRRTQVYFVGCAAVSLAALSGLWLAWSYAESPSPAASMTPVPSVSATPSITGSPTSVSGVLAPADAKSLGKEFQRAQATEIKALQHRQSLELKELKDSQKIRESEWKKREADARHKFFAIHTKGQERRTYVQDFEDRWKALRKLMADERAQRIHEQEIHLDSLKADQDAAAREFQDSLKKGERPPARLWPSGDLR